MVLEEILWVIRFFFGACIFGFVNNVVDRLTGRERGTCGKRQIAARYFWTGLTGGAAFVGCVREYGCGSPGVISARGVVIFAYLGILLAIALIDWDRQMIYDRFHIMILVLAVLDILLYPERGIASRVVGALVISVPMLILALVIPGAFGGGDIKLMAVSGLLLGSVSTVCAMIIGIVTGGGYTAVMLAGKKLDRRDRFAFGPFLAVGLAVAVFRGEQIAAWYLQFR